MPKKRPRKAHTKKMTGANNLALREVANSTTYPVCESVLSELTDLVESKSTKEYARGSVIFSEDEKPRGLYVLCEGRVKISIASAEGRTLVLRVAHPGELLGINATLSGKPYRATVKTLDKCKLDFIPRDQFLQLLEKNKNAYADIAQALGEKLNYVVEHTRLLFLSQSAAEKLARLLLKWCDDGVRTPNGTRVDIRLTHEELAQMICSSRETVTRLLNDLKQKRILEVESNSIVIRNRKALEKIANG
jgi:CRP/FNR family transcriptional regulator